MHPLSGNFSKMSELTKKEDIRIQGTVDPTQEKGKRNLWDNLKTL